MFGIGMGPSQDEKTQYGNLSSASGFATGEGTGDITASDAFMKAIVSGDATKTSQALAPQIGAAKKSAQEDIGTRSQFGTRSGGTAAANAASTDKVHSDITNLVAQLTGGAVSGLSSAGQNLLTTGISGSQAAFGEAQTLQQQRQAQLDDIFKSAASVAAAPFTGGASLGMGKLSKPGGGGGGGMDQASFTDLMTSGALPQLDTSTLFEPSPSMTG